MGLGHSQRPVAPGRASAGVSQEPACELVRTRLGLSLSGRRGVGTAARHQGRPGVSRVRLRAHGPGSPTYCGCWLQGFFCKTEDDFNDWCQQVRKVGGGSRPVGCGLEAGWESGVRLPTQLPRPVRGHTCLACLGMPGHACCGRRPPGVPIPGVAQEGRSAWRVLAPLGPPLAVA